MTVSNNAIVLAGGRSSRFGTDKAFATYYGKPLIERILCQLFNTFSKVVLVTNDPDKYSTFNAELTSDIIKDCGPLSGIHAGLKAAKGDYVFVTACDMPFISLELISLMRLLMEVENRDAVVVRRNGKIEPFNGFYSRNLIPEIEEYLAQGKTALFSFLKGVNLSLIDCSESFCRENSAGFDVFTNINRREDLNHLMITEGLRIRQ